MAGRENQGSLPSHALVAANSAVMTRRRLFSNLDLPARESGVMESASANRRQTPTTTPGFGTRMPLTKATGEPDNTSIPLSPACPRWQTVGDPGALLHRPLLKVLLQRPARVTLDKSWLNLSLLDVDEIARTAPAGSLNDEIFHQICLGFDPEFQVGAGNVLRPQNLAWLVENRPSAAINLRCHAKHQRSWVDKRAELNRINFYELPSRPDFVPDASNLT